MGVQIVPVNWHWVAGEVAYVLDNSGAKVLLVEDALADVAAAALAEQPVATRIVVGDEVEGFLPYEGVLAEAADTEPADQALGGPMFYTSGTTGWPKGVRNGMLDAALSIDFLRMYGDGFSQSMHAPVGGLTYLNGPVYHSAQWAFSMLPLFNGSGVVMRHGFDAAEALRIIDTHGVTNTHLVPTQMIRLLKLPDEVRQHLRRRLPADRVARRRALPARGQAADDRVVGPEDLRVLRRHRGRGGQPGARARSGWSGRGRWVARAPSTRCTSSTTTATSCPRAEAGTIWIKNLLGHGLRVPRRPRQDGAGPPRSRRCSRSATSATSTRRATCSCRTARST